MALKKRRDRREYRRRYYLAHREKSIRAAVEWVKRNRERSALTRKTYKQVHRAKLRKKRARYKAHRRHTDPLFRLKENLRCQARRAFTRVGASKNKRTIELLGCSIPFLKKHFEAKFTPGMTWKNYGQWHVDHITPLATATSKEEAKKLCHYTNLAPLWAEDNIAKGARQDWKRPAPRSNRAPRQLRR